MNFVKIEELWGIHKSWWDNSEIDQNLILNQVLKSFFPECYIKIDKEINLSLNLHKANSKWSYAFNNGKKNLYSTTLKVFHKNDSPEKAEFMQKAFMYCQVARKVPYVTMWSYQN